MIEFCKNCIMPNSRPRIEFNKKGVCNACTNYIEKQSIDWAERKELFLNKIKKIKDNNLGQTNEHYDVIVPWSGGKDSTSIALKLKFELGLNPLLVTFSPLILNEVGEFNRELLLNQGFDSIFVRPNQNVAKKLARRFFIERGNPKIAWDAGVNSVPIQVAINYNIPIVIYAEHGESEYGGLVLSEESKMKRDLREVIEHQIGDFPENWISKDISIKDLSPYIYPNGEKYKNLGVTAFYFSYFFRWSMYENYEYVKSKLPNFKTATNGRTSGTFTNFDSLDDKIDDVYYYMQFIKFGFGRATRDSCRMIQNNQLTRSEAIDYARKYDDEFPSNNLKEVLDYLKLSKIDFDTIVDKHRNQEIWKSTNNSWKLIKSL